MSLSFFPNRENLYKEIQQWVALRKVEMLLSLCNCCTYKAFDCTTSHQCRMCNVRKGILKLVKESGQETRRPVEGEELLGVC